MTYLVGAIVLIALSVYALLKSHRLYVEEKGLVIKIVSILFAITSVLAANAAYHAVCEFIRGLL